MTILSSIWDAEIWYSLPLIVAISIVYGATRHEHLREIVLYSIKSATWLVCFLGVIFLAVWWATMFV